MSSPYIDGLKMLGRRELSEAQVRQRLARKGHADEDVEAAIQRLKTERALDDARVADAIARTEITVKRHGRMRVRRQIESAGIAPALYGCRVGKGAQRAAARAHYEGPIAG